MKLVELVSEFLGEWSPKSIIEVGSRDGLDARALAEVWPAARIWAFEPNPATIDLCRANLKNLPGVRLVPVAVSNQDRARADFYQSTAPDNPGYSSLFEPTGTYFQPMPFTPIVVETVRLDTFIDKYGILPPELLWLDAQGSELHALEGLGDHLKHVRALWTEFIFNPMYHDAPLEDDLTNFLRAHGFTLGHREVMAVGWWGDAFWFRAST